MAAQRIHGLLLCCLVILLATHEVQGLFECFKGCPSRCQRDFHESLYVCAVYCGMKCTCSSGGSCDYLGSSKHVALNSEDQDLKLLEAAKAKAAAAGQSPVSAQSPVLARSPFSTGQSSRKIP